MTQVQKLLASEVSQDQQFSDATLHLPVDMSLAGSVRRDGEAWSRRVAQRVLKGQTPARDREHYSVLMATG